MFDLYASRFGAQQIQFSFDVTNMPSLSSSTIDFSLWEDENETFTSTINKQELINFNNTNY
jgi:hypothetical protein